MEWRRNSMRRRMMRSFEQRVGEVMEKVETDEEFLCVMSRELDTLGVLQHFAMLLKDLPVYQQRDPEYLICDVQRNYGDTAGIVHRSGEAPGTRVIVSHYVPMGQCVITFKRECSTTVVSSARSTTEFVGLQPEVWKGPLVEMMRALFRELGNMREDNFYELRRLVYGWDLVSEQVDEGLRFWTPSLELRLWKSGIGTWFSGRSSTLGSDVVLVCFENDECVKINGEIVELWCLDTPWLEENRISWEQKFNSASEKLGVTVNGLYMIDISCLRPLHWECSPYLVYGATSCCFALPGINHNGHNYILVLIVVKSSRNGVCHTRVAVALRLAIRFMTNKHVKKMYEKAAQRYGEVRDTLRERDWGATRRKYEGSAKTSLADTRIAGSNDPETYWGGGGGESDIVVPCFTYPPAGLVHPMKALLLISCLPSTTPLLLPCGLKYHPFTLGEPLSIPGRVAPVYSHVGIVLDDAAGRRGFSWLYRFPRPFIPALLRTHLASPLSTLKTSILLLKNVDSEHLIHHFVRLSSTSVMRALHAIIGKRIGLSMRGRPPHAPSFTTVRSPGLATSVLSSHADTSHRTCASHADTSHRACLHRSLVVERGLHEVRGQLAFPLDVGRATALALVARGHQDLGRVFCYLKQFSPLHLSLSLTLSLSLKQVSHDASLVSNSQMRFRPRTGISCTSLWARHITHEAYVTVLKKLRNSKELQHVQIHLRCDGVLSEKECSYNFVIAKACSKHLRLGCLWCTLKLQQGALNTKGESYLTQEKWHVYDGHITNSNRSTLKRKVACFFIKTRRTKFAISKEYPQPGATTLITAIPSKVMSGTPTPTLTPISPLIPCCDWPNPSPSYSLLPLLPPTTTRCTVIGRWLVVGLHLPADGLRLLFPPPPLRCSMVGQSVVGARTAKWKFSLPAMGSAAPNQQSVQLSRAPFNNPQCQNSLANGNIPIVSKYGHLGDPARVKGRGLGGVLRTNKVQVRWICSQGGMQEMGKWEVPEETCEPTRDRKPTPFGLVGSPQSINIGCWRSVTNKSPTNHMPDMFDGRHVRRTCRPGKQRHTSFAEEGLQIPRHMRPGIVLLKYGVCSRLKDGQYLGL
ncbi:hypothetical protein PR048_032899 [Dryococelus australis]|uniref:Uncharacterized protein n=1 Tax=Dryococelus australis TaxID=614101 RepID=A0ABQ9G3J0_9NEOP|nr:hypothetical protein PR048_032899 [Dryococelus australis]